MREAGAYARHRRPLAHGPAALGAMGIFSLSPHRRSASATRSSHGRWRTTSRAPSGPRSWYVSRRVRRELSKRIGIERELRAYRRRAPHVLHDQESPPAAADAAAASLLEADGARIDLLDDRDGGLDPGVRRHDRPPPGPRAHRRRGSGRAWRGHLGSGGR